MFKNNVADDLQFGQFQAMVDYLITSGFVAERINRSTPYGPALPLPRAADAARAVDAYAHAAQAGLDVKRDAKTGRYTLEKKSNELRTCFAYKGGALPEWLKASDPSIFCGLFADKAGGAKGGEKPGGPECVPHNKRVAAAVRPKPAGPASSVNAPSKTPEGPSQTPAPGKAATTPVSTGGPQGLASNGHAELHGIAIAQPVLDRMQRLQQAEIQKRIERHEQLPADDDIFPVKEFTGAHISMKLTTRSAEGILYYLGEIVRRETTPEFNQDKRTTMVKVGLNYGAYPTRGCDGEDTIYDIAALGKEQRYIRDAHLPIYCNKLFVVNEGPSVGDSVISVTYNGVLYSIPHSLETGGRSSQVTELVKQVLNLNTSAKQLPSTTVISVVGAQ